MLPQFSSATAAPNFLVRDLRNFNGQCLAEQNKSKRLYEIVWVKNGEAVLQTNTEQVAMLSKQVCLLNSDPLVKIATSHSSEGFYIALSQHFFQVAQIDMQFLLLPLHQTMQSPKPLMLDNDCFVEMEDTLQKILNEQQNTSAATADIIYALFKVFFIYLSRCIPEKRPGVAQTRDATLLQNFVRLLKTNFIDKKQVSDYAAALYVTPSYLNQVIKKTSGFTASYLIQQQIITHAKYKAQHTDHSMKQIAYELGFDDTAHFSKFFKLNSGLNFSSFKRALTAKLD